MKNKILLLKLIFEVLKIIIAQKNLILTGLGSKNQKNRTQRLSDQPNRQRKLGKKKLSFGGNLTLLLKNLKQLARVIFTLSKCSEVKQRAGV